MLLRRAELLLALLLVSCLAAASAQAQTPAPTQPLTREAVDEAAAELRRDPALKTTRSERRLRWVPDDKPKPPPDTSGWVAWLRDLIAWMNDAGRFLVWALGALAVALLALQARLLWQRRAQAHLPQRLDLPTHVNQLDIRPQALPSDVGAAALLLWQQGQLLEAMSLLYRGALSQLVHTHAVPIRSSSTEGDCLRLAQPVLAEPTQRYFAALVAAWRSTVYAGRPPSAAQAQALCAEFAERLNPRAA